MKKKYLGCCLIILFSYLGIGASELFDILKKKVQEIGRLNFKTDLAIKYLNSKQLSQYLDKLVEEEYSEPEKDEFFAYLMGFIDERTDFKKIRKRVLLENVAGFYNEKTKELYALNDYQNVDMMSGSLDVRNLVIIHELRHAIQDQYFNLSKILGKYSDFDDRELSRLSAVEGDATFIMVKYTGFTPEVLTSFNAGALLSFSPIKSTSSLYTAPELIKYQLIMPYIEGLKFVNYIFKKKGWKGLNKILQLPPNSSEQILHPEKYLKKEIPKYVRVHYQPKSYLPYHSGVIGEYFLNILLDSDRENKDLALGWGGDKFEIYRKSSKFFLLWKSVWDNNKYCANFFNHFKRFLKTRFKVNFRSGNNRGVPFMAGRSESGFFFLKKYKNNIFYLRSNDRENTNGFIKGGNYD